MVIFGGFSKYIEKSIKNLGNVGEIENLSEIFNVNCQVFKLRQNQREVFNNHLWDKWLMIISPPGSGKSTTVAACIRKQLEINKNRKAIISVPQTIIAKTFGKCIIQYDDGSQLIWDISNDLCNGTENQKVNIILKFLNKKKFAKNDNDRILITTHSALSLAHTKVKDLSVYNDIIFVIDEAHHIMYSNKESNRIGSLIKDINGNTKCSIWCVTATPYRGDQLSIIPPEQFKKFKRYCLPLDKHWKENINHIENFEFNFVAYKEKEIFKNIEQILSLERRKTIFFCPFKGDLVRNSDKYQFKKRLIKSIKKIWSDAEILDLITERNRKEKKALLEDPEKSKKIDVILSLKIFDEGSDWVPAEQCIDLTPTNSLTKQYQRFGRPWRDYVGKKNIYYYCFIPYEDKFAIIEEKREHLTRCYNVFICSVLLEDVIGPLPYSKKKSKNKNYVNPFIEEGINEDEQQIIMTDVVKKLLNLRANNDNPSIDEVKEVIGSSLDGYDNIKDKEEVANHIGRLLKRRSINKNKKTNPQYNNDISKFDWLVEAGFDKIWSNDLFNDLLIFTTNTCDINHFSEFRELFNERKTVDEYIKKAEELAANNGGYLPVRLQKTHNNLYSCILRHPKRFEHIPRNKLKTIDDHVKNAELLAKNNGGILPIIRVRDNYGLYKCMKNHPKRFEHIPREKRKTIDEHVKNAELLAKNNGGILPIIGARNNNSLHYCMKNHPKRFEHIPQEKIKTIDEHVKNAELLAKNNGGILPIKIYKINSSLYHYVKKYPKRFEHIPREKRKTIDSHIKDAELLAKNNGGLLPIGLEKTNPKLYTCILRHPKRFEHIPREKRKTIDEHVKNAELLAKNNGGILPIKIYKNSALYACMLKYPDEFAHISREKQRKTIDEHVKHAEELAANNSGFLPKGLKKTNSALYTCTLKHRDRFAHIPRKN